MAKSFTTKQMQAGFDCGHMTIYNWRQGTATKDPLPCNVDGGRVTFPAAQVVSWAKKHGVAFDATRAESGECASKPGPKPKVTAAAKKAPAKKVTPVKKSATALKQKPAPRARRSASVTPASQTGLVAEAAAA